MSRPTQTVKARIKKNVLFSKYDLHTQIGNLLLLERLKLSNHCSLKAICTFFLEKSVVGDAITYLGFAEKLNKNLSSYPAAQTWSVLPC